MDHWFYDPAIFYFMKRVMGGRIRIFVSGGAPLLPEIRNFLAVVFSAPIFEAYGATETAGCLTGTAIWDRSGSNVGGILPCLRMQLRDLPELDCYSTSN